MTFPVFEYLDGTDSFYGLIQFWIKFNYGKKIMALRKDVISVYIL